VIDEIDRMGSVVLEGTPPSLLFDHNVSFVPPHHRCLNGLLKGIGEVMLVTPLPTD
jgi:hypothetical protein